MSDEWTANDYSNIVTVGAAALCSVLMVVFKSRCLKIVLCCGLFRCDRKVSEEDEEEKDKNKIKGNNKDGSKHEESEEPLTPTKKNLGSITDTERVGIIDE